MSQPARRASFCYARDVVHPRAAGLAKQLLATAVLATCTLAAPSVSAQDAAPPPAPAAPAASGLVVVTAGVPDESLAADCKELAREVYKEPAARPSIDEAVARVLCGGDPGSDARSKRVAELRQSLSSSFSTASHRVLAEALASELGVRGLVFVDRSASACPQSARCAVKITVARAERVAEKVTVFVDPVRIEVPVETEDVLLSRFLDPAKAVVLLAEEESEARGDGSTTGSTGAPATAPQPGGEPGPRKTNLLGPAPKDAPPPPGAAAFYDSPWFWVAAGSVAAIGLTVLIVSQVTDVDRGTVTVQGEVTP